MHYCDRWLVFGLLLFVVSLIMDEAVVGAVKPSHIWFGGNLLALVVALIWYLYYLGINDSDDRVKERVCVFGIVMTLVYVIFFTSGITLAMWKYKTKLLSS